MPPGKWFAILLPFFLSPLIALGQPTRPGTEAIEFTEETLDNGLHVIYAPLHQAPVVHVRVLYHVGSRDERPDRQGFAHLFEHMMFRGSAHVRPQEHVRLIRSAGGTCNAETHYDYTDFFETLPANQLELALWLEADRMASFEVTDEAFDQERKVVAQEWAMRYGRPYASLLDEFTPLILSREGYKWPVIGNMVQLRQADVQELREFFRTWYVPQNATLVIAGDFEPSEARSAVKRLMEWIPGGRRLIGGEATSAPASTQPATFEMRRDAPAPAAVIGVRVPAYGAPDQAALRVTRRILAKLVQGRLVRSPHALAEEASLEWERLECGGAMALTAILAPGMSCDDLTKAFFAQKSVFYYFGTQQEVSGAASGEMLAAFEQRESCSGIAQELGRAAVLCGSAARADGELAALSRVKQRDVEKVLEQYFSPAQATTLRLIPAEGAWPWESVAAQAQRTMDAPVRSSTRPAPRSAPRYPRDFPQAAPVVPPAPSVAHAQSMVRVINGCTAVIIPDHRQPVVHWAMAIPYDVEDVPAGKQGVAELTAGVLQARHRRDVFLAGPKTLELSGVSIDVDAGADHTVLIGSALSPRLADAIEQTRRMLREPDLSPDALIVAKLQLTCKLARRDIDPEVMAARVLASSLGRGAPWPTTQSVSEIALADVEGFHRRTYQPDGAIFAITGDVTEQAGESAAHALLDEWKRRPRPPNRPKPTSQEAASGMRIIVLDRPGLRQARIRIAAPAFSADSTDRSAGAVAGTIVGRGLGSRLARFVRSERGYVYSAEAGFLTSQDHGWFLAEAQSETQKLVDTLDAMLTVFQSMRDDEVSPEELSDAKNWLAAGRPVRCESAKQKLRAALAPMTGSIDGDIEQLSDDEVLQVGAADVRAVMEKYVRRERMTVVVLAPAEQVSEQLSRIAPVRVVRWRGAQHS